MQFQSIGPTSLQNAGAASSKDDNRSRGDNGIRAGMIIVAVTFPCYDTVFRTDPEDVTFLPLTSDE